MTITNFGSSPEDRPKVFRVPDDSDVEDTSSDNDRSDKDGSIRHSSEMIRNTKLRAAAAASQSPHPYPRPIDLTSNNYPLSNIRGDDDYTTNALPPLLSFSNSHVQREVTYIDLSSSPPEQCARFSPISTGPELAWGFVKDTDEEEEGEEEEGEQEKEGDKHDSDVSDMEKSIDVSSRIPESCPHSPRSNASTASSDDYDGGDAEDSEEEDFEEYDDFMDRDSEFAPGTDNVGQTLTLQGDYEPLKESSEREDCHASVPAIPKAVSFGVADNTHLPPLLTTTDEEVDPQCSASTNKSAGDPFGGNVASASVTTLRPQFTPVELPKLTTPPWTQSYSIQPLPRLPSLTEAVYPLNPTSMSPHSETVAEAMGAKTGKLEYFLARDENKKNAATFEDLDSDLGWPSLQKITDEERLLPTTSFPTPHGDSLKPEIPTAGLTEAAPSQSEPSHDESSQSEPPQNEPSQNEPSQNEPSQGEPSQIESSQIEPSTNEPTERLAASEWAASGTQFLNSPHEEVMKPTQNDGPMLDETSAYQFELSKKAAVTDQAAEAPVDLPKDSRESMLMDICDLPDNSTEAVTQSPSLTPMKRKAGEISELTAKEKVASPRSRTREARKRFNRNLLRRSLESNANRTVPQMSDAADDRTPKRLRRVAEVLGYAALGGVAVVSALIATAPTL
jgi:hypothetical protein